MRTMAIVLALIALAGPPRAAFAQQTDQPPAPPTAPLPNRANEALPSWLGVRGEFRERVEGFTHAGFTPDRDDMYWLSRLRLNASVTPSRFFSAAVQVQDARVARKSVGPIAPPFRGPFDLRQAYVDVGDAQGGAVAIRAGRQELAFGEQRLVGHLNWTNTARTFDAVRVTARRGASRMDAFVASVVRVHDAAFDRSGSGNRFAGLYGSTGSLVRGAIVEPYFFWRADRALPTETGTIGDLDLKTIGARWNGRLPDGFDYGIEIAAQSGSLGSDAIGAWAGHWQLRRAAARRVAVLGEFNYASGDDDPADGSRGTFDQLYPTGHDKYGLADQVGWRNIRHARAGVEFAPAAGWPIAVSYHAWWLASRRDALYGAGGAAIARVAGGARTASVGQEIDVQIARAITPQIALAGGYAHLFPGAFLKEATPGAPYRFPYVMVTYVFLAEE